MRHLLETDHQLFTMLCFKADQAESTCKVIDCHTDKFTFTQMLVFRWMDDYEKRNEYLPQLHDLVRNGRLAPITWTFEHQAPFYGAQQRDVANMPLMRMSLKT